MARRTLSTEVREGILKDLAANVNKSLIAKTYGVSIPTVYNFLKRQILASENLASVETTVATVEAPVAVATRPVRVTRKSTKNSK